MTKFLLVAYGILYCVLWVSPALSQSECEEDETKPYRENDLLPYMNCRLPAAPVSPLQMLNRFVPSPFVASGYSNINISNSDTEDFECVIAANPIDSNTIAVATILSYSYNTIYVSSDGGTNWNGTVLPPDDGYCDPSLDWDANGTAYLCGLHGCLSFPNDSLYCGRDVIIHRSLNGGQSWDVFDSLHYALRPSAQSDTFYDEPFIYVDRNPVSPYTNSLYVFYVENAVGGLFGSLPTGIKMQYRRSGDSDFSAHIPVSQIQLSQFPHAAFGLNGEIYVTYVGITNPFTLAGGLYFNSSTDGGKTFSPDYVVFSGQYPDSIKGFPRQGTIKNSRIGPTPTIVVDTSHSEYRGTIYICFAMPNPNSPASGLDIFVERSTNNGTTWSIPVRVNDDPLGTGADQLQPSMAISPDGALGVMFYDRRDDPNNYLLHTYIAISTDGGSTFVNARLTSQQTDPLIAAERNGIGVADYCGITATRTAFYPVWSDGRANNGSLHVYTARVPIPGTASSVRNEVSPTEVSLSIYPNPFSSSALLRYNMSQESGVTITIMNTLGQKVATLLNNEKQSAGEHILNFNATNLGAGIYYCLLQANNFTRTKELFVVK
ncbi:MAG TPA: T9SS type A sorting domain-containing protein [Candidatus Kapabacteria bacterium]|nr:T9SS type A sorting domain-containing protein [Candidatus Kapabacteria bacterium]